MNGLSNNTFEVLEVEVTMDEAERLNEWLKSDAGKPFWKMLASSKKTAYDSFLGKAIDNPITEVLDTQRQKALLAILDEIISVPENVDSAILSEKDRRNNLTSD